MTVQIENIGTGDGAGGGFPPKDTQLRIFTDDFQRPNAGTLGSSWGMAWYMADFPFDGEEDEEERRPRPFPYDAAVNPRIAANRCEWFARRRSAGIGYSVAWPWPLAWMTQQPQDQFSEIVVDDVRAVTDAAYAIVVYSGNAGSLDPDHYGQDPPFHGRYGFYAMGVLPNGSMTIGLVLFGANPSATPDGDRGHAGVNFVSLGSPFPAMAPLPARYRLEARRVNNAWQLIAYQNGIEIGQRTDDHLLQGMPAMAGSQYGTNSEEMPISVVHRYQGGLIGAPIPPAAPFCPPAGTQTPFVLHPFSNNEDLLEDFAINYIGSDRLGLGFELHTTQGHLDLIPRGGFEDPAVHPYQTAVVLAPLQLAWMTQARATQQSTVTIEKVDQAANGGSAASLFCCFSGSLHSGRAYAVTAANDGNDPQHRIVLNIQRYRFGTVPTISIAEFPMRRPVWENIRFCGYIEYDTRVFFQAIDLGSAWRLIVYTVLHPDITPWHFEFRGTVVDDELGPGMPGLGAWAFSSDSPVSFRGAYVGGWGPDDMPFPIP